MCFSILYKKMAYENSVHKKLLSKNLTGPNLCIAMHINELHLHLQVSQGVMFLHAVKATAVNV